MGAIDSSAVGRRFTSLYEGMSPDNVKGLVLALSSSVFIGASCIIKKKGLRKAGSTGVRAGVGCYSYLLAIVILISPSIHGIRLENRTLKVGEELFKETLPLKMGSRLYQLQGLKPYSWYEVKISYPASIPSSFTLQLIKGGSDLGTNRLRKLLNTEKLIFQTESLELINDQGGTYVLVSVEAEGIVAIPGVQERETVIFNIVCDELLFGLPHKVWPVVILAVLCLALGFILPLYIRLPFPVKRELQEQHELKHR